MRILMLGNSFTSSNQLPQKLAQLTGAEITAHTRGGARLAEQFNPKTKMGSSTLNVLTSEHWDYVILQEMSHGPITAPISFQRSVAELSNLIKEAGAVPILYATWGYHPNSPKLKALGLTYQQMCIQIQQSCQRAADRTGALIATVGKAFIEYPEIDRLYDADLIHPSSLGTEIAAETIAKQIFSHSGYITTYGGTHFLPTEPMASLIHIKDIAHALSLLCRGNGHVKRFFSVGQHCIRAALEAERRGYSSRVILACLLHDASEAYLSDVPRPFKRSLPGYKAHEERLLSVIYQKYLHQPLTEEETALVKTIDDDLLYFDLRDLLGEKMETPPPKMMVPFQDEGLSFAQVEEGYLELFYRYFKS